MRNQTIYMESFSYFLQAYDVFFLWRINMDCELEFSPYHVNMRSHDQNELLGLWRFLIQSPQLKFRTTYIFTPSSYVSNHQNGSSLKFFSFISSCFISFYSSFYLFY